MRRQQDYMQRDADIEQKVTGYLPKDDGLQHALTGADIVVIPAGIPR
jgi:malate/lactate dehydrogenase